MDRAMDCALVVVRRSIADAYIPAPAGLSARAVELLAMDADTIDMVTRIRYIPKDAYKDLVSPINSVMGWLRSNSWAWPHWNGNEFYDRLILRRDIPTLCEIVSAERANLERAKDLWRDGIARYIKGVNERMRPFTQEFHSADASFLDYSFDFDDPEVIDVPVGLEHDPRTW